MIVNFIEKSQGQHINMLFNDGIIAPYEVEESWTEETEDGDWYALSRFKYGGYDLRNKVPSEFIIELRFYSQPNLFDGSLILRKDGSLITTLPIDRKDVQTLNHWFANIGKLIKLAGNKLLDNI